MPWWRDISHADPSDEAPPSLPKLPELRWGALGLLLSVVLVSFIAAFFGRVEVTVTAHGSLHANSGPRPVLAETGGRIRSLVLRAGQAVHANQVIASVDAHDLRSQLERRTSELELLRQNRSQGDAIAARGQQRTLALLDAKRSLLLERAALAEQTLAREAELAAKLRQAVEQGVASENEATHADVSVDAARERLLVLRQELNDISLRSAELEHTTAREKLERELSVRAAEAVLSEANTRALLGEVRAPRAGRLESLLVSEGQVVKPGDLIGRIVPDHAAPRAVVFVAAKDAALLAPGVGASLEFPSLSTTEYGKARAVVARVAGDVALAAEVAEIASEQATSGPLVRVELDVIDDGVWQRIAPRVRSGERLIARCRTDQRRIATLAFDFLRDRWP